MVCKRFLDIVDSNPHLNDSIDFDKCGVLPIEYISGLADWIQTPFHECTALSRSGRHMGWACVACTKVTSCFTDFSGSKD